MSLPRSDWVNANAGHSSPHTRVVDFASAGYLGLSHAPWELPPWRRLSVASPAAHRSDPEATELAAGLAFLTGCEAASIGRSTLHVFWDLLGMLARTHAAIYADAGAYPIGRWCCDRAAMHGVPVRTFAHHDIDDLRTSLRKAQSDGRRPIVLTDGLCPLCGDVAPIAAYLNLVRSEKGLLIVDDTQALGVLGTRTGNHAPYGVGGGGSLSWAGVKGPDVILVSSLAKGFGVPLAMIAGSEQWVSGFEIAAETRMHCSAPTVPEVLAARHALEVNRREGDAIRQLLVRLVTEFRSRLKSIGVTARGGLFPVQTLELGPDFDSVDVHVLLARVGFHTALFRGPGGSSSRIGVIITAGHRTLDLNRLVDALANTVRRIKSPSRRRTEIRSHDIVKPRPSRAIGGQVG